MMLLDVDVWLAAFWANHVVHPAVAAWFNEQDGELRLCRVAQTGLLRLLSNSAVASDLSPRRQPHAPDRRLSGRVRAGR
ncbi:PIN domain-containing protein [Amycolatopsis alkalitolerans]|uniref:hypothetical protein n=1 Tax=Amycolatopsis alkalitolerans TaxID=2547244 RepID=UPI00190F75FE|nr:hypothetical protein [Amycolatopsis alkalitolerans]